MSLYPNTPNPKNPKMKTLEVIAGIVADKTAKGVWPTHALEREVKRHHSEADAELMELEQSGQIKFGQTINDRYITVIP